MVKRNRKSLTGFKERVWQAVRGIKRGQVLTYKEVAQLVGSKNAWRAVGNALHENTNPEIPCHRVIRSNGTSGGYRWGRNKKALLLKQEGVELSSAKF